jgi:putative Mg2+ transporter-C (MgtC) family protein
MSLGASSQQQMVDTVVAICAAYLFALPLAWERHAEGGAHVGWRTLPLASVGTCAYLLISRYLHERGVFDADGPARTLRAMMTGIGFIGGGAILKRPTSGKGVKGLTTGAAVWATGAIGASVAHGYYTVALVLSLTNLFVVEVTGRLARRARAAIDDTREERTTTE